MPPVKIFWYDGLKEQPEIPGVPKGEYVGDPPRAPRPQGQAAPPQRDEDDENPYIQGNVFKWSDHLLPSTPRPERMPTPNGSVFVGDKGILTTGTYGENTRLLPIEKMRDYKFPQHFMTRSPGHYRDWIRACKGGEPSCSNFGVAGPFTEWILLGVIALRTEGKLEWDSANMRITNNSAANQYVEPLFRKDW
jgi:hypothetical protein